MNLVCHLVTYAKKTPQRNCCLATLCLEKNHDKRLWSPLRISCSSFASRFHTLKRNAFLFSSRDSDACILYFHYYSNRCVFFLDLIWFLSNAVAVLEIDTGTTDISNRSVLPTDKWHSSLLFNFIYLDFLLEKRVKIGFRILKPFCRSFIHKSWFCNSIFPNRHLQQ